MIGDSDERRGWLGARDDRARLLALLVLSLPLAGLGRLPVIGSVAAGALLLAFSTRLSPRRVARRAAPVLALVVLVFLLTPFWRPLGGGQLLFAGWAWGPTVEGLNLAGVTASRVIGITVLAVACLDVAPFDRSLGAMAALRVPALLVHTALLSHRTLFRFREDLGRAKVALEARGFRPGFDADTATTFAGVSGGLLVRSVARAERLERAMRCRGYDGAPVLPPVSGWRPADTLLIFLAMAIGAGLVAVDRQVWL